MTSGQARSIAATAEELGDDERGAVLARARGDLPRGRGRLGEGAAASPDTLSAMTVDPLLSLLVGALGAALIGLLGALIQSRREHARWIREQRLAAYLAYARESERILSTSPTGIGGGVSVHEAQAATAVLRLLGPERVFEAAFAFTVSAIRYAFVMGEPDANQDSIADTHRELSDARQAFIEAARRELRIRG